VACGLGAGAQAGKIPNCRQGQHYKLPALTELSTCAIEVSTPHLSRPNFWGAWDLPDFATPKTFYQEQS